MKHHDVFIPILRDHDALLVLAEMLQSGEPKHPALPTEPGKKAAFALDIYKQKLAPYFLFEEDDFFPRLEGVDPFMDQLIYVLKDNHTEIRDMFRRIEGDANRVTIMDSIGKILEQHIELEQNELFPLCEKHFSDTSIWELTRPYKR